MQVLRTLLLGAAAGLLAAGTGQAGEVRGKAKPPGHANHCSAYGAGFRRVPGGDLCVKLGGWARAEATSGSGKIDGSALNANVRSTSTLAPSARGYLTNDMREETGYGTVRAYFSVGVNHE